MVGYRLGLGGIEVVLICIAAVEVESSLGRPACWMTTETGFAALPSIEVVEPTHPDIGQPSAAVAEIMEEMLAPGRVADLSGVIAALRPKAEAVVEAAAATAVEAVTNLSQLKALRQCGPELREIEVSYRKEVEARAPAINRDPNLSAQGKKDSLQKIEDKRNAARQEVENRVQVGAGFLDIWYGSTSGPPNLSEHASRVVSAVSNQASFVPPDLLVSDGLSFVEILSDPNASAEEKKDAAAILHYGYRGPWTRRATQPEAFAKPYQQVYADALALVHSLLDASGKKPVQRLASALADQARADFEFLKNTTRRHGWDQSLSNAVPKFFAW